MRYDISFSSNYALFILPLFVHVARCIVHFKHTAPNDSPDQYVESHRRRWQQWAPTKHGVMGCEVDLRTMPLNNSPIDFEGYAEKDP
jgi:hypothetical protein